MSQNNLKSIQADGRVFSYDEMAQYQWSDVTDTYPYVTGNVTQSFQVLWDGQPCADEIGPWMIYEDSPYTYRSKVYLMWKSQDLTGGHVMFGAVGWSNYYNCWMVNGYDSTMLTYSQNSTDYVDDFPVDGDIVWGTFMGNKQSITVRTISTPYFGDSATDEAPASATAKIYRKRGDVLREFKPMQDNPTDGVVLYDSENDELTTSRDLSLNSINVVDRIVVAGISYLNGDVVTDKNVSIHGDLIVDGTTYTTQEQSLDTTSDYVVLRQNKGALSNTSKSGLVVSNYSSNKHAAIGVDNEGTWRVSDNAEESVTSYTNFSYFNGTYYNGLTQDSTISVITNGATIARDADELSDCVWYDGNYYYHDNLSWFLLSLTNNEMTFDIDNPISDSSLIATLDGLTKYNLEYYRSLSVMVVTDTATSTVQVWYTHTGNHSNSKFYTWNTSQSFGDSPFTVPSGILTSEVTQPSTSYSSYRMFFESHYANVYIDRGTGDIYLVGAFDENGRTEYDDSYSGTTSYKYIKNPTSFVKNSSSYSDYYSQYTGGEAELTYEQWDSLRQSNDIAYLQYRAYTVTKQNNQPISTRSEEQDLTDGAPMIWDAPNHRIINEAASGGEQVWKSSIDANGNITYGWGQSSTGSSFVFSTMAEYITARSIPEGQPGHIPSHALIVIEDEIDRPLGDNITV